MTIINDGIARITLPTIFLGATLLYLSYRLQSWSGSPEEQSTWTI